MNGLLNYSKRFLNKNAATILTCIGGAGVVATSIMAVKATPKAMQLIEEAKKEKGEELTKIETIKVAGPVYIPSIIIGVTTISCIFSANVLNKRNQAALTSAYALVDNSYKEYKKKTKEMYGKDADRDIRTEIAKEHYEKNEINTDDDLPLFFDEFSNRYYNASNETILRAEYEINQMLATSGGASLNDYYKLVGLSEVDYGERLGWSSAQMSEMYWDSWLYFHHTKVEMEDGMECWIIDYTEPFVEFDEY